MSNQSEGRKISQFLSQTTVASGAYITYVDNGTNYKILFSDFVAALGVTGTIVQDGDVLGTPILDTQGSVNNIRNLEAGSGISTSVSPENGVTIEHNFIEDTTGVELVVDLTADQPKFRSMVAGAGINVSASNGQIQIATSGVPATTKTVIVNDINDFPAAVAGVITLQDDTEYLLTNDISTSNRFVLGNNTLLNGSDNIIIALTYTNSGNMFTSLNKTWTLKNITINCTSGTFIDFDGTGAEIWQMLACVINADTLGTIDDISGIHIDDTQFTITTDGFLFGGANGVILVESNLGTIAAGTFYDLGTATFSGFSITEAFVTLNGSSVYLDGTTASGNIDSGGLGSVHNSRFFGAGTPLQTIDVDDIRWSFFLNDDIDDTRKSALMSQVSNATATTITVAGTAVKLAGTWTEEEAHQFTTDATGKMTYNGPKTLHADVTMSFSGGPVSGTNKAIKFYVAKNGTVITNSGASNNISSGDPSRTTLVWHEELAAGDYIEAFVANDTDTINVLVTDAILRLG
jgi:hypothetical protein